MRRWFALTLVLWVTVSCSSVIECSMFERPAWEKFDLPEGMRFQSYNQSVYLEGGSDFSIEEFHVIGDLPNGIGVVFYGDEAVISGTPTELGTFSFKLDVQVQFEDGEGNASCSTKASRGYTLRIN